MKHGGARWKRIAAWTAGTLVALAAVWLIAINALLAFGGVEALVTREAEYSRTFLEFRRAWSVWPTRVHVYDATFRLDAHTYELEAELAEGTIDIRLLSLFGRRLHFERIEATGVRVWYREKVDAKDAHDPRLAGFPPFEDTPPEVEPAEAKPRPEREKAFGVDIDQLVADVDALWIDEFDTEPCGRVSGAVHWVDGYEFSVPPTTVELVDASLWIGGKEAMRGIHGTGTLEVAEFDTYETKGPQVPGYLSFDAEITAQVHEPEALALYAPDALEDRIAAGSGPIAADLHAEQGLILPGSAIHYRTERIDVGPPDTRVRTSADVLLEIEGSGRPHAVIELADTRLFAEERVAAEVPHTRATLTADHAAMTEPWSLVAASLRAPEIRVDDLRTISRIVQAKNWRFTGGSLRGAIDAELAHDDLVRASVTVRTRGAGVRIGEVTVKASASARARVHVADRGKRVSIDRIRASSDDVMVRSPKGKSEDTRVRIADAEVHVRGDETTIAVRGEVEDARPALEHFTRLDPLLRAIPDLGLVQRPIETRMRIHLAPRSAEVELVEAKRLGLHARGLWRKRGDRWRAAFLFSGTAFVGFSADQGGLRRVVPASDRWLDQWRAWVHEIGWPREDRRSPARVDPRAR